MNVYILRYLGREYELPIDHFEHSIFFHKFGLFRSAATLFSADYGKDVINGGAYIGDSTLILAELAPRTIYAFKPLKENFLLLRKTIYLNRL